MSNEFQKRFNVYKKMIDKRLEVCIAGAELSQAPLRESMMYSLLAGGKRLRGSLTLEFCRISGAQPEQALDFAAAVEMIHTYSLIHDDLPCMDDDDYRRSKPTNHKVFGEWQALLAGDALQSEAFRLLLNARLPAENIVRAASILANAAGYEGMCGGQYLDMAAEGRSLTIDEIAEISSLKTAAMIAASCVMGCVAAGSNEGQSAAARKYGSLLGIAFQVRDDMLDIEGSFEELGKPSGSDMKNQKSTFVSIYGMKGAAAFVEEETEKAKNVIKQAFEEPEYLIWLADYLKNRKN